jgi:hypothetical protein
MTNEEMKKIHERIYKGLDMISEKAEMIGRAKSEWSLNELGEIADIQKDISESFKNLIKVHVMTSEHSVEKY